MYVADISYTKGVPNTSKNYYVTSSFCYELDIKCRQNVN